MIILHPLSSSRGIEINSFSSSSSLNISELSYVVPMFALPIGFSVLPALADLTVISDLFIVVVSGMLLLLKQ